MKSPDTMKPHFLCYLMIVIATAIAYLPSFLHIARADQVIYLAETALRSGWWDTAVMTYDLNRSSCYMPGDEIFFRPFLYFMLGNEKFFFGYQYILWQCYAFLIHALVLWQMLRLLLRMRAGSVAYYLTAFFSLMTLNIEMISWHHITGYMSFILLALIAFNAFFAILVEKEKSRKQSIVLWLTLLLASFTLELGVVITFFAAVFLVLQKDNFLKNLSRWLCVIILMYFLSNLINLGVRQISLFSLLSHHASSANSLWQIIITPFSFILWWLLTGLLPSIFRFRVGPRTVIAYEHPLILQNNPAGWGALCGVIICILLFLLWLKSRHKKNLQEHKIFHLLCLATIIAFACQVSFRSIHNNLWDALRINLYYGYIFWSFFIIQIVSLIHFDEVLAWQWGKYLHRALIGLLIAITLQNACQIFSLNMLRTKKEEPLRTLLSQIETLIHSASADPMLTFHVPDNYPGNIVRQGIHIRGQNETVSKSVPELLYPGHFTRNNPKFEFTF